MDVKKARLIKILHHVVDEFITLVENSFLLDVIDVQKVFYEIIKRKVSITQELKSVALSVINKFHSEDQELDIGEYLHGETTIKARMINLVDNLISQDFAEIALNETENFYISKEDLHNLLYFDTLKDTTSFAPSPLEMGRQFDFATPFFSPVPFIDAKTTVTPFTNSSQLFPQFENATLQFNADLSNMRRLLEKGFSVSDLNDCQESEVPDCESQEVVEKIDVFQQIKNSNWCGDSKEAVPKYSAGSPVELSTFDFELEKLNDDTSDDSGFVCWEDCLGRGFLREHIYISEATPEAVYRNISDKDYHAYNSLVNIADAITEDEMIFDILDVLTGIPSSTFYYDIHGRKFRIKPNVHLPNLSTECTAKIVAKFLESGSMYYALQNFSRDFLHASEGSVFKGMQSGVWQVLCIYKEYIEAVKAKFPDMLFLRTDVLKNAELLLNFGIICGIDPEKMIINEIPKGLGLLSYLHDVARSHKRNENGILIAVLLKYAYAPYFRFLNEWMTEGCCNDPHNEFQIIEDTNFLKRRDSLFWKFAYTENIDDPTRMVPPELRDFSLGILDCGKSIKLLKYLSPELYNLKFFTCKPPPPLSLVCSFPAVIYKVEECVSYILLQERADLLSKDFDLSEDEFFLESQKLVNEKQMLKLVNRRYDIITASCASKSNLVNFKNLSSYHHKHQTHLNIASESQKKCDCSPKLIITGEKTVHGDVIRNAGSLSTSTIKCTHGNDFESFCYKSSSPNDCDSIFSGKLHDDVGLIFSSCGYVQNDTISDSVCGEGEWTFQSANFGKQLCLSSYNCAFSPLVNCSCNQFTPTKSEQWKSQILNSFKSSDFTNTSVNDEHFIKEVLLKSAPTFVKVELTPSNDKYGNSFLDQLTSLLISEYGDSTDEIHSYIQVTSLQRLIIHNFNSVLKTRIHVVEKAIMKCIVKEYQLDTLLSSLRNIFFLQDENFSQSLCKPLFDRVMKCRTPGEFAKHSVLNEMLANAISDSDYIYNSFIFSLNASIGILPSDTSIERIDFLKLLTIECKVNWPLNIIVHHTCIQQYSNIFSVLVEIEFLCWLLGKTWRHLIVTAKELNIQDESEYREMMLSRFEMDQFVRVIRNSILQHLQGPLWEVLQKSLSAEQSSIDDLETAHNEYLEKVLARCFLTDETCKLHDILVSMFHQVFRICYGILDCVWEKNQETGHYETSYRRRGLTRAFELFTQHQKVFLELWLQNILPVDRYSEGVVNKKVWTLLGQRLPVFPRNNR